MSRFGKTLAELAKDPYIQRMVQYQELLDFIRTDLQVKGLDPQTARLQIPRRKAIEQRIIDPMLKRLKEENLTDYLKYLEIRTMTGAEIIQYDEKERKLIYQQSPLGFTETEQKAISKIMLGVYLNQLGLKLKKNYSQAIHALHKAPKFHDLPSTLGILSIFENALSGIQARVLALNGEISIIFNDEESRIDAKALAQEITKHMQQQHVIKPYRPFFIVADDTKGVRISLFDKSDEVKRMVSMDEHIIALGDSLKMDTFIANIPNNRTLPVFLGSRQDSKDFPMVIVTLDEAGQDQLKEKGTSQWMANILDVMEQGQTWSDVKMINGLFSINQVRDLLLEDLAMNSKQYGGINLDAAFLNLVIKRDPDGTPWSFDKKFIDSKDIIGFSPLITHISSPVDVSRLLLYP